MQPLDVTGWYQTKMPASDIFLHVRPWQRFLKRPCDVALVILLLPIAIPLFVAVSAVLLVANGRPVLFRQQRIGFRERPFTLYKFRTMREPMSGQARFESDDERTTKVGDLVRRTSLDELPQLLNVLLGQMSFVGPRPLLEAHLPLYTPTERRRHLVRPGVTGLAQVSGRRDIRFRERFAFDVEYVEGVTFLLDMKIMSATLKQVVSSQGGSSDAGFDQVDDIGVLEQIRKTPPV